MAERVHPTPADQTAPAAPSPPPPPARDYIIQVPKDQIYRVPPPENQRRFERYTRRARGGGRCRRCCCWALASLLILLLAAGAAVGALYLAFRPKAPRYAVESLSISGLDLNSTVAVSPRIVAGVRATNPNRRIGLYYRSGSSVEVFYAGARLCGGQWPAFYQGRRNETMVRLELQGEGVRLAESARGGLRAAAGNRRVPLDVRVEVPVRVKLGGLKLWGMKAKVRCEVVVDRLAADAKVLDRSCSVKVYVF